MATVEVKTYIKLHKIQNTKYKICCILWFLHC